jgi:hypothetical protein
VESNNALSEDVGAPLDQLPPVLQVTVLPFHAEVAVSTAKADGVASSELPARARKRRLDLGFMGLGSFFLPVIGIKKNDMDIHFHLFDRFEIIMQEIFT